MDWVNPHSWVHFDVTGPDGKVVNWGAETPPTNVLFRSGWKKDSLKIGDEIQVQGFAAKDGTPQHVGVDGGSGVDRTADLADDAAGGRQGNAQVSASMKQALVSRCACSPADRHDRGTGAAARQTYVPPKTAAGQPDLQGIWQVLNTAADVESRAAHRVVGRPGGVRGDRRSAERDDSVSAVGACDQKRENFQESRDRRSAGEVFQARRAAARRICRFRFRSSSRRSR